MKLLRRGVHIVAPATSHVPMFPGCVREAVRAFVESGGEAAVDAQCVSHLRWPPFAVPK